MGKKAVSKKSQKSSSKYSDLSEDEIEKHYNDREKIMLDESEGEETNDSFDEEAIMDLPTDEEEEEYSEDDVFYDEEEKSEEEEDGKWGKSKKAYYAADQDALDEEATEAKKLQKKKLAAMKSEDFTGDYKVKKSKPSGPMSLEMSESEGDSAESAESEESEEGEDEFELNEEQVATLSADEKIALLEQHSDEFRALVADFKDRLGYLETYLQPLMSKIKELPTGEGLSFLKVKYQLLTAYCTNVAFYLQLKLAGKPVQNHPVLEKLIKFRLLLEKIKPMENKLRHQVDRLLKAASGQVDKDEAEAAKFKPNPDMLLKAEGASDDEEEGEEGSGVYKAPKLAAMHYPEDESAVARRLKHEEHLKKVNASHRLISDIRAEFEDAPEEEALDVVYGGRNGQGRRHLHEREEYEEDNFMRFTLDKKTKRKLKETAHKAVDELEDLNDFIEEIDGKKQKGNKKSHKAESFALPTAPAKKEKRPYLEDESDVEDDFYQKVKAAKMAKKSAKPQNKAPVKFKPLVDMGEARDRPANQAMMKNRGLTPHRSKKAKNPRVKQRSKYEKAQDRLGSFRAVNKQQSGKYGGEDSGIRTNIVRSTKF